MRSASRARRDFSVAEIIAASGNEYGSRGDQNTKKEPELEVTGESFVQRSSFCLNSAGRAVEDCTKSRAEFGSIFFQSPTILCREPLSWAGSEIREAH